MSMAPPRWFDFHIHSTCSDGTRSPADVLRLAADAGLAAVSITDHDTVDAHLAATDVPAPAGAPRLIPGVELSTRLGDREAHILGYFPGGVTAEVASYVEGILAARGRRLREGVLRLRERGIDISWDECARAAPGRVLSRAHIAQVLAEKRYVGRPHGAYQRHLGADVVPLPGEAAEDAVAAIRALGGIGVWAHPGAKEMADSLERLRGAGLDGIEVHHPRRRREEARALAAAARGRGLLVTGGSDWHGRDNGPPFGLYRVGEECVLEFLERLGLAGS
jgi:predicted metal-dependent phosphoesterase TrpH